VNYELFDIIIHLTDCIKLEFGINELAGCIQQKQIEALSDLSNLRYSLAIGSSIAQSITHCAANYV
jgi:hypothetical protein